MNNEFDDKAASWDANPMHLERSKAIAAELLRMIPVDPRWNAVEFGAGTGLLSLELKDKIASVQLLDSSTEMVRVMNEKLAALGLSSLKAHAVDLADTAFPGSYDLLYTQMAMHHVADVDQMVGTFRSMLRPGGYLAIADLCPEDGSFHDSTFTGHRGFDVGWLAGVLAHNGFTGVAHRECFVIRKPEDGGRMKSYPVFLMVAQAPLA